MFLPGDKIIHTVCNHGYNKRTKSNHHRVQYHYGTVINVNLQSEMALIELVSPTNPLNKKTKMVPFRSIKKIEFKELVENK